MGRSTMNAYAEKIKFLGEQALQAGNEHLEIVLVPGWGSNLISIVHKESGRELLRSPYSSQEFWANPILFGTPVLFPPNRIGNGTFTFQERTYQLEINEKDKNNHIHGFLYKEKWNVVAMEAAEGQVKLVTELDSAQYPHIYRQFPHHFTVRITYLLEGATVRKNATIYNRGQEPFPWGFGYHTTFLFPEESSTFALTAEKRWVLNDRLLPTGELERIERQDELNRGTKLKNWKLDDVFLSSVLTGGGSESVITYKNPNLSIVYQVDENLKQWVVYNADGIQGFVCPEPYTWVTNAPNLDLPPSLTGLQVLSPGEEMMLESKIVIKTF